MQLFHNSTKIILSAILLIFLSHESFSMDGNELHKHCSLKTDSARTFVVGFVSGSTRGIDLMSYMFTKKSYFCTPSNLKFGQSADIVCKWLSENPRQRHLTASGLVLNAIEEAFPCPKNR
jgi:hypothetical protein